MPIYANPPSGSNITRMKNTANRLFMSRHENVNALFFAMSAHAKINKLGKTEKSIDGAAFNALSIFLIADCELLTNIQNGNKAVARNMSLVGIFIEANSD